MYSTETFIFIVLSFVAAGFIKGLIGLGFPTIILAMLSLTIGVRDAMAIMLLPCFLTNIWQAMSGGNFRTILLRIWPLLLAATFTIWITTAFIANLDSRLLSCLLGIVVFAYGCLGLRSPQIIALQKHEAWMTPLIGVINGIITGLTGTFVVPAVLYMQGLKMGKDSLIQAMGILFLVSTAALGSGLFSHDLLGKELFTLSAGALLPSFAGMAFGQYVRGKITEQKFQAIFFTALLLLGSYILIRSIF